MTEQMNEQEKVFDRRKHLMQLKSKEGEKDYLPVQWRIKWFRDVCPHGSIETELVHLNLEQEVTKEVFVWNSEKRRSDKVMKTGLGIAVFKATVKDENGGTSTGFGSESAIDFPDFIEKAETKAIGRALAALGYGTQFAPDLNEAHRIVDAPVDRTPVASNGNNKSETDEGTITEQQVSSIRKLCHHLSKQEPDNLTTLSFVAGKRHIQTLTTEYKESRQNTNKAS